MNVYGKIRTLLPKQVKGFLTKLLYLSGVKPLVNDKHNDLLDKGTVVFSADFELAWAFRFSKKSSNIAEKKGLIERNNFGSIVELFNKYKIPVTWATVGHLFLDNCKKGKEGVAHEDMPRPFFFENRNWSYMKGDWYEHDPCTENSKDSVWYAPDLISRIISSPIKHEIGCHTFSHIDCTYENCTKELMIAEVDKCVQLAAKLNLKLESFVFPGGTKGNLEVLMDRGFICYRQPMKNHIDYPYIDAHGLVAIPSSFCLDRDPYNWTVDFHKKIIDSYINRVINSKQVCHFWFHPSMEPWYLENILPYVLESIASAAQKGNIQILTMGSLARKVLNK